MSVSTATITATAGYVQKPFQVTFQQLPLRELRPSDVLIDILACGVCGFDMETAEILAETPVPIGHEIVAIVRQVGSEVTHVKPGDQVVIESGTFCCNCDNCRNGRVDLCNSGPNINDEPVRGFADMMIAPARAVVPAPNIDPMAAVLAEPCGVAVDVVKVAEIGLCDRVLVVGAGPIGLMTAAIARRLTTGPLVVADLSVSAIRLDTAKELGADATVMTDKEPLADCGKPYGGFDKVLITAPPFVIPDCMSATAFGGYLVFIGSDFKGGGVIPLNTHQLHFGKQQLRASFASPALYMPEALHLLRTGVVPAEKIISHRFPLSQLEQALRLPREQRETTNKVVVIPDARFSA